MFPLHVFAEKRAFPCGAALQEVDPTDDPFLVVPLARAAPPARARRGAVPMAAAAAEDGNEEAEEYGGWGGGSGGGGSPEKAEQPWDGAVAGGDSWVGEEEDEEEFDDDDEEECEPDQAALEAVYAKFAAVIAPTRASILRQQANSWSPDRGDMEDAKFAASCCCPAAVFSRRDAASCCCSAAVFVAKTLLLAAVPRPFLSPRRCLLPLLRGRFRRQDAASCCCSAADFVPLRRRPFPAVCPR